MNNNMVTVIKKSIILISLLFSVLVLSSCVTPSQDNQSPVIYWRTIPSGDIQTNDVERLQEIVPFDIILPEYLPEDMADYHPDFTYSKDYGAPGDIYVEIGYWTTESPHYIIINEFVSSSFVDFAKPHGNLSYNFLRYKDYKDIEVLERTVIDQIPSNTKEENTHYFYEWIRNDVNYSLETRAYSQEEARNVVESMIR